MSNKRVLIEITNGRVFCAFSDERDVELIVVNNDFGHIWKPPLYRDEKRINEADETATLCNLTEIDIKKSKRVR